MGKLQRGRRSANPTNGKSDLVVVFNIESVPAPDRQPLMEDTRALRDGLIQVVYTLLDAGERFTRWKERLPHGAYLPWVATTGYSPQSARDASNAYKRFKDTPLLFQDLDMAFLRWRSIAQLTGLGCQYVDIDFRTRATWKDREPRTVLTAILLELESRGQPLPSYVLDSGRGLMLNESCSRAWMTPISGRGFQTTSGRTASTGSRSMRGKEFRRRPSSRPGGQISTLSGTRRPRQLTTRGPRTTYCGRWLRWRTGMRRSRALLIRRVDEVDLGWSSRQRVSAG